MNKRLLFINIMFFALLVLNSCQTSTTQMTNENSYPSTLTQVLNQPNDDKEPYPIAYPTFEPYPFKTSAPNTVTIHGILVIFNPEIARPIEDGLFLVLTSKENAHDLSVPFFSVENTPRAEFDERTGEFYFTNIEPGYYVLAVLTTGTAQIPVFQMESDVKIMVEVNEHDRNKVIELGHVRLP